MISITKNQFAKTRLRLGLANNLASIRKGNGFFNDIHPNQISSTREVSYTEMRLLPFINVIFVNGTYTNTASAPYGTCMHQIDAEVHFDCYIQDRVNPAIKKDEILCDIVTLFSQDNKYYVPDGNTPEEKTALSVTFLREEEWGIANTNGIEGVTIVTKIMYNYDFRNPKVT